MTEPAGVTSSPPDVAAARAGALAQHYRDDVFAYCLRRLHSREEAEDAAQMVFLNAYRGLAGGTVPRLELAWLYSIAEHVVAHRWRTISRRRQFEVSVDSDDIAYLAAPETADNGLSGVVEALSGLPAMERRALLLREWQGFSYSEVADDLGVSNKVVERLLMRGRRSLAAHRQSWRRDARRIAGLGLPWPASKSVFSSGVVAKALVGAASVALIATAVPALRNQPVARPPVAKAAAKPGRPAPVAAPTWSRPYAHVVVTRTKHRRHASHLPAPRPSSGQLTAPVTLPVIPPDETTPTSAPPAAAPIVTPLEESSVADVSAPITAAQDTLEPDGGPPPPDPGNSGNHWGWANSGGNGPKDPDPNTSGQ